jgi:magnesium transporter
MIKSDSKPRPRRLRIRRVEPGAAPGTITVDPSAPVSTIRVLAYGPEAMIERENLPPGEIPALLGKWPVVWINVDGLGNVETLQELAEIFQLHRLALEDVVNVHQRPKVEPYENHLYAVLRMASTSDAQQSEQLSLFLGSNFVLTFQERHGDCLEPVRERIRKGGPRLRKGGPDYLAYAVLDAVVDHYFPVLEAYGDRLEALQDEILERPSREALREVYGIRAALTLARRAVYPLRDALAFLLREEVRLVTADTRLYLRDTYDHVIQLIDILQSDREIASGLIEFHVSSAGNRMNEIMKVLTVFAALFIPLTFVAGIYGMNFNAEASPWNMPELDWYLGYPLALLTMVVVAGAMLLFFWKKGFFR